VGSNNLKIDALGFVNGLSLPADAVKVIDDICDVFFPKAVSAIEKLTLKSILTGGQPDFEWTLIYNEYLADPTNPIVANPVRTKVELVLSRVFQMPQFHTI
jgi:hypothetical protein